MKTSGLEASLNVFLGWNKARASCFVKLILALFAVKTVSLKELAVAFSSDATIDSRYRRLQRFFALFKIDYTQIARWIFSLYFREGKKFYLAIDRTNWFYGKNKINIFMLSIAYEGMAIPIFWTMLPKAGNSNFNEQKELILKFTRQFGISNIQGLLADREFASGKLFEWLNKQKIPFYIRIKEGSDVCIRSKKIFSAKQIFNHINPKTKYDYLMMVWLFGQKVFLSGSRSEKGELMIVATNQNPVNAIACYLRRWEIESLFQCLKGRGFRFEETHITHLERIEKLTALLAVGFVWAHRVGEYLEKKKPIIQKYFHNQMRPQQSYFRYGLDHCRNLITSFSRKLSQIKSIFNLLIPTQEMT